MSSAAPKRGRFSGLRATTQALKHREYRLMWASNLIAQTGDWMDQVAFSWLVYDMTHSAIALVLVNFCRAIPILLFTLVAGVVADRMPRQKLMVLSQVVMMAVAIILSTLMTFDWLSLWMVFVIATARGIVNSFNQPARQALISELVPKEDLPSAVALNATTFNLSKAIGPATSGVLIAVVGVTGAFYINSISIGFALVCLLAMKFPPPEEQRAVRKSMAADFVEGIRYLQREKAIRTLVILAIVPMFLGQPYQTMLTIFAKDIFHAGSIGLGVLQSTAAIGSLVGIVFVASKASGARFNQQMVVGLGVFGAFLTLFAASPSIAIALPLLFIVGISQQTYQTSNNTLIQLSVDREYRGRVLSTLYLQRGMVPLGTMLAGLVTELVGARWATGGMAVALLLIAVVSAPMVLASLKKLPNLEQPGIEGASPVRAGGGA